MIYIAIEMVTISSLKLFHKILISGLVVVFCMVFLENIFNRQIAYGTVKPFIHPKKSSVRSNGVESANVGGGATTDDGSNELAEASAVVLWWTPFIDEMEYTKNCGDSVCFFTGKRKYLGHDKLKILLFYGSNLNATNLPLPRSSTHMWAIFHEESPKNVPLLLFQPAISLFNLTATYSQKSDLPLTLQALENFNVLIDRKYFIDVQKKNRLQIDENLAPVLYIQSICDTMSGRDDYVTELMKFIKIDSYGKCLNNKLMPNSLTGDDYINTIDTEEFRKFNARYKFVISYENSVCNDYITEKIWRPLTLGVVPIYFGAPNIQQWLPNNNSAILINEFKSPKHLAEHIMYLNNNDFAYNQMLDHKVKQRVDNQHLRDELNHRIYETNSIVEDFECFVCQRTLELPAAQNYRTKSGNHYENCGLAYPKMSRTPTEHQKWQSMLYQGRCEASLIQDYVKQNEHIDRDRYNMDLIKRYDKGICGN